MNGTWNLLNSHHAGQNRAGGTTARVKAMRTDGSCFAIVILMCAKQETQTKSSKMERRTPWQATLAAPMAGHQATARTFFFFLQEGCGGAGPIGNGCLCWRRRGAVIAGPERQKIRCPGKVCVEVGCEMGEARVGDGG